MLHINSANTAASLCYNSPTPEQQEFFAARREQRGPNSDHLSMHVAPSCLTWTTSNRLLLIRYLWQTEADELDTRLEDLVGASLRPWQLPVDAHQKATQQKRRKAGKAQTRVTHCTRLRRAHGDDMISYSEGGGGVSPAKTVRIGALFRIASSEGRVKRFEPSSNHHTEKVGSNAIKGDSCLTQHTCWQQHVTIQFPKTRGQSANMSRYGKYNNNA